MTQRLLPVMLALATAISGNAQLTRGYISGTVTDPSGASVSGVKVVAIHQATDLTREMPTNDAGVYRFAALEPGTYHLEFSDPRFQPARVEGILLDSGGETVYNH